MGVCLGTWSRASSHAQPLPPVATTPLGPSSTDAFLLSTADMFVFYVFLELRLATVTRGRREQMHKNGERQSWCREGWGTARWV